ncbi:type II toxin-antitoxin system RelE/ParE family toxin [Pseudomonas syringae]|uniref:Addiction module antitoxin n=3 Tax=Pseudomonas syringae TaxID=317 RepID=A0AB74A7Q8_PSESX|nr:type II toxin-antitoxin system RelE/ParE family toxin [Pseudomonas syringae]AZG87770.1 type II toxin-antitoxin system RelE/ParE family toxin [Pseudomonas syringae pv. pisi str. PP1]KPX64389.1 Addiction module antitoxin [Pseudomonas syringae pv. lapsa]KPY99784.1 Addiction module antitoxin [Pseudomonas syringae pv. aptata]MBI6674765.1 type II toxin-antitoxin system RelE/ParE family toxin [Pseudomonas syringae]MBI6743222.1 type II toxin-antitoxin system RelE/ParE family toxin [Pseudomonas syri
MLVEWRPAARMNLKQILSYIADRNIRAASELGMAIEVATSALPQHPYLYRHGRVHGTREIVVHPNYLVVYKVTDRIEVLAVLHARQAYPTDAG